MFSGSGHWVCYSWMRVPSLYSKVLAGGAREMAQRSGVHVWHACIQDSTSAHRYPGTTGSNPQHRIRSSPWWCKPTNKMATKSGVSQQTKQQPSWISCCWETLWLLSLVLDVRSGGSLHRYFIQSLKLHFHTVESDSKTGSHICLFGFVFFFLIFFLDQWVLWVAAASASKNYT